MKNYRRALIFGCTFIGGLYFFLEFVLPKIVRIGGTSFEFGKYHEQISLGVQIVGSMAIGLGVLNILLVHGVRCLHRKKGWVNSFALLAGMIVMLVAQSVDFVNSRRGVELWKPFPDLALFVETIAPLLGDKPSEARNKITLVGEAIERVKTKIHQVDDRYLGTSADAKAVKQREAAQAAISAAQEKAQTALLAVGHSPTESSAALSTLSKSLQMAGGPVREHVSEIYSHHPAKQTIKILYDGFFTPLGSAMFSLLAFYIAYAAYRSFRLRSVEAAVLMTTAIIIILGQIPQGPMYVSENLPAVRLWLMENVNTPGNRAIYFGSAIAGLAMAMRMWFSMERSPLEADESSASVVHRG